MIRRVIALNGYLLRGLLFSLAGILYVIGALVFAFVAFQQRTPEAGYFTLLIGLFGCVMALLATLSVAARANHIANYPFIVRLPSRVEYLAAVFLSALQFTVLLQLLVAVVALLGDGPDLRFNRALEIPPLWLAADLLAVALALHASDLVTRGWSRVYLFGLLAILLFTQQANGRTATLVGDLLRRAGGWAASRNLPAISPVAFRLADWISGGGIGALGDMLSVVFWPFRAIVDAAISGEYGPLEAIAPAFLIFYATLLFLLAAELYATKDLVLAED